MDLPNPTAATFFSSLDYPSPAPLQPSMAGSGLLFLVLIASAGSFPRVSSVGVGLVGFAGGGILAMLLLAGMVLSAGGPGPPPWGAFHRALLGVFFAWAMVFTAVWRFAASRRHPPKAPARPPADLGRGNRQHIPVQVIGVLTCLSCWARLRLLAVVKSPASIVRYLAAAGELAEMPRRSPLIGRSPNC